MPSDKDRNEKFDSIWAKAKTQAKEALDWSKKVSTVGKLKMDHVKLQKLRTETYQELGERVFTLLKEGRFSPLELQELTQKIDDLNHKIELQTRSIEETHPRFKRE